MVSYIFLDLIAKRVSGLYPYLPVYTIHDCIMTLEEEEDKVKDIIVEIIKNKKVVLSREKIEYLHEPEFASI